MRALPAEAAEILSSVGAAPRLVAHLTLVHDVAAQLVVELCSAWPRFVFDAAAVAFGAATHDIGKALHPAELVGPGSAHEEVGYRLLIARGISEERARFARTHAQWSEPSATVEDLLVSLADKVWKGRREEALEQAIVGRIAVATGAKPWDVFMKLDDVLSRLAVDADARLEFQARNSA